MKRASAEMASEGGGHAPVAGGAGGPAAGAMSRWTRGRGVGRGMINPMGTPPTVVNRSFGRAIPRPSLTPEGAPNPWHATGARPKVRPTPVQPAMPPRVVFSSVPRRASSSTISAAEKYGLPEGIFDDPYALDSNTELFVEPSLTKGMGLEVKRQKLDPQPQELLGTEYVAEELQREIERACSIQPKDSSSEKLPGRPAPGDLDAISTVNVEAAENMDTGVRQLVVERYSAEAQAKTQPNFSARKLPIVNYMKTILERVKLNRVMVISGTTGCGKTTQVPRHIMDDCAQNNLPFNIVVTQPRRIAAITVARRVAEEKNWPLGELIGYQVGMDRTNVGETTRLLYCTTGVLLQKLIHEKQLSKWTHIIVDEVHERSDETDMLLMVIRRLMWRDKASAVKVILMSATADNEKFMKYMEIPIHEREGIRPGYVNVLDKVQELTVYYLSHLQTLQGPHKILDTDFKKEEPRISPEQLQLCLNLILRFDAMENDKTNDRAFGKGAVLVFLPGIHEINTLHSMLVQVVRGNKTYLILPLHSSINIEEQKKAFERPNRGQRKVILATNIAESSITVPDIEYVIDFCVTKSLICDPETHYPTLQLEWASKANCEQRAGRAGRTREGRVYRLIPSEFYEKLDAYPVPELVRSPLDLAVLRVKKLDLGTPKELLALCLDPPLLKDIRLAVVRLKRVGALSITMNSNYDPEDGELTLIGKVMAQLPIDVQLSKLIILGHAFGCLQDCVTIAACLSLKSMFSNPHGKDLDSYKSRLAWADRTFSDLIAYLNAFKFFERTEQAGFLKTQDDYNQWCSRNFIQLKRIREVRALREDILTRLRDSGLDVSSPPNRVVDPVTDELMLKIVICGAFYPHYFTRMELRTDEIQKSLSDRDPFSSVKISNLPANQGVIYVNALKELFSECSDQMDIVFEETHAILTFSSVVNPLEKGYKEHFYLQTKNELNENQQVMACRDTAIKTSVYVALKMASVSSLHIPLFREDEARRKLEKLTKERDKQVAKAGALRSCRFAVPRVPSTSIPLLKLSGHGSNFFPIFITYVVDCAHFWAQFHNNSTKAYLRTLKGAIENYCGTPVTNPTIGSIILAPGESKGKRTFSRARIEMCSESQARVFFVDYGYHQTHDLSDLVSVDKNTAPPELLSIPCLAFECKLSEIKPSAFRSFDGNWEAEAKALFVSLSQKVGLEATVYSVINRVVRMEVTYEHEYENRHLSINQELIDKGHAEKGEESPQSVLDNEARYTQGQRLDLSTSNNEVESLHNKDNCFEVFVPNQADEFNLSRDKFKIRGPCSPLAVEYQGISKKTYHLKVDMENNSVNCITLESDPNSRSASRLMVASSVHISVSGRVKGRDTTLMPNIRGFSSLMVLLFCPTAEFRKDVKGYRYTGAICGLGCDPETQMSFDPENDIEMAFDVVFSNSDISLMNLVRHNLNLLLSPEQGEEKVNLFGPALYKKQVKIREIVLKLLKSSRLDHDPVTSNRSLFKWGLVKEQELEPMPLVIREENRELQFLPLHPMFSDFDTDIWARRVKSNLDMLKDLIESKTNSAASCMLCGDVRTYTPHDLYNHLNSTSHLEKVAAFKAKTSTLGEQSDSSSSS